MKFGAAYLAFTLFATFTVFQGCSEARFKKASGVTETNPVNENVEEQEEVVVETPPPTTEPTYQQVGCASGLDAHPGNFGTGCQGQYSCWRKKEDGGLEGVASGDLYGWPGWYVQCEMQHNQLSALCPKGSVPEEGTFDLPCSSQHTCWQYKSGAAPIANFVDGAAYGWDNWYVQCELGSPQI